MAAFNIHRVTGMPLVQLGTAGADNFTTVGMLGLLAPGLSQDAQAGFDTLTLRGLGPLTVTDAAFAGLRNFERLDLASLHATTITLGAAAALAFGNVMEIRAFQGKLTLDGSALTAATRLSVLGGNAGDVLTGGAGDDSIAGRVGDDTLSGGAGRDTLRGGADQDDLSGGAGDDSLFGEGGHDTLRGDDGQDRLGGGAGEDLLSGGAGQDTLLGDAGDDTLRGDAGADTLRGGLGLDQLDGGLGDDLLEGGTEADVFRLSAGVDFISDFSEAEGDRLDVSGLEIRTLAQFQSIAVQVGTTLRLNTGAGDITRLRNVTLAELEADDLILAPARAPTDIAFASGPLIITGAANGGFGLPGAGILTATDPDFGDALTFSVNDPRFTIAFDRFLWVVGTPFDFAVEESVTLTITVTDSFGLSYSEAFTIAVSEPGMAATNLTIGENLVAGAVVGEWAAVEFVPRGAVTFEVVSEGSPFTFVGNRLVTNATLDFETLASHSVTVRLRDAGADAEDTADDRVLERSFTIAVEDRDDENLTLAVVRDLPDSILPGASANAIVFANSDSVFGTSLPDDVRLIGRVTGGDGSHGAAGDAGEDGSATLINGPVLDTRVVGDGTAGGEGGAGAAGGSATARADSLTLRLGNSPFALGDDQFRLEVSAAGGAGGQGGLGGAGGMSDDESDSVDVDASTGAVLDGLVDTTGQGGAGGAGGAGAAGGEAEAFIIGVDASFTARASLFLTSTAVGGAGGQGGDAGPGGFGSFDADLTTAGDGGEGGAGGAGGRGGDATSLVAAAGGGFGGGDLNFTVTSTAMGGAGGRGGHGGPAASNRSSTSETQHGEEPVTITDIMMGSDIGGDGGQGGNGGDAAAEINDLRIGNYVAAPLNNTVRMIAEATGGAGGAGGLGAVDTNTPEVASDGTTTTTIVAGRDGMDGAAGSQGIARISMSINTIYLEAGDDTLAISAFFNGSRHELSFVGNVFDGGAGNDYFDLSAFYGFGVTLDIAQGRMTFEGNPWSTLTGFERFRGTEGDDLFLDGADSQVYEGGSGQDVFVFAPGHGNDSIRDFTQGQDRIDFSAFSGLGFADLLVTYGGGGTPDDPAYVVVSANGGADSVGFNLTGPLTLLASDFIFA
ncbi:MAG: hypothetical protein K5Q68_11510 [Roseococcus sp.]|nr:hypothetical protein [Roseococcus sp.]